MLEVLIATVILTVVATGLLGPFAISIGLNKSQGELATRTTEYCQDKMEQLLALNYIDTTSDTTQFPTASTGGTGLSDGGGINPNSPVANYVDYVASDGTLQGANSAGAFYKRVWQISTAGNLKTITVVTAPITNGGGAGVTPQTKLVSFLSNMQ
jgi:type II secretory pathway pseudopilin PulG